MCDFRFTAKVATENKCKRSKLALTNSVTLLSLVKLKVSTEYQYRKWETTQSMQNVTKRVHNLKNRQTMLKYRSTDN